MIRLTKGESVKFLDPQSSLIPFLKHEGWAAEGDEKADDDLASLRAEAEALGIKFHHKAGAAKLAELIAEAK